MNQHAFLPILIRPIERDDAGHFAALEHPDGLMQDVRDLANQAWKSHKNLESTPDASGGLRLSFNPMNSRVRPEYLS